MIIYKKSIQVQHMSAGILMCLMEEAPGAEFIEETSKFRTVASICSISQANSECAVIIHLIQIWQKRKKLVFVHNFDNNYTCLQMWSNMKSKRNFSTEKLNQSMQCFRIGKRLAQ